MRRDPSGAAGELLSSPMTLAGWLGWFGVALGVCLVMRSGFEAPLAVGGDNALYVSMARVPWEPAPAPWGLRPLGPFLVWLTGLPTGLAPEALFPAMGVTALALAMTVLCGCARLVGVRGALAGLPIALLAPTYGTLYYLWNPYLPEPVTILLFSILLHLLLRERWAGLAVLLPVAVAARETALLWLPCIYLAGARRLVDAAALRRTLLLGAAPVGVFLFLALRTPVGAWEPGYVEHTRWFVRASPSEIVYYAAYALGHGVSVLPLLALGSWRELPPALRAATALLPLTLLQTPFGADWVRYVALAQPVLAVASVPAWGRAGRLVWPLLALYVTAGYAEDWMLTHTLASHWARDLGSATGWARKLLLVALWGGGSLVALRAWCSRASRDAGGALPASSATFDGTLRGVVYGMSPAPLPASGSRLPARQPADHSVTIFVPAYNEAGNLTGAITDIVAAAEETLSRYEILLVDDGSTDSTGVEAAELARRYPAVRVLTQPSHLGLAAGYRRALGDARMGHIGFLPGDGEVTRASMERILRAVGTANVVVPYHGNSRARQRYRRFLTWSSTTLTNVMFGMRLRYYQGPCVYPVEVARAFPTRSDGFYFLTELLVQTLNAGHSYVEVPLEHRERRFGRSKAVSLGKISLAMASIGRLWWVLRVRRQPRLSRREVR